MNEINSMQSVLDQLYSQMMPLCTPLMGVARVIAGFLALCTIIYRVWGPLSRAEPLDIYPLLHPFAKGLAILFYPALLSMFNGILQPTVMATSGLVSNAQGSVAVILQNETQAPASSDTTLSGGLADNVQAQMQHMGLDTHVLAENILTTLLEWLYEAAALVISAVRTFILTVLSILGPLVIGVSVLDGFRSSYQVWLARYINVYLWLPVANIYGAMLVKIQVLMLTMDTSTDFAHNQGAAYMVFLLMGIVGYMSVPSTAGYVVQAIGGQTLVQRVTTLVNRFI
jgi:hypothetical protein